MERKQSASTTDSQDRLNELRRQLMIEDPTLNKCSSAWPRDGFALFLFQRIQGAKSRQLHLRHTVQYPLSEP